MKIYKTIIIDDDIRSIELLTIFIEKYCKNLKVSGAAQRFNEAVELIEETTPDIIFLDIKIHKDLGFDLLDMVNHANHQIIFISGHQEFALNSFKYDPVDFLLKPFGVKPFKEAVNRALARINKKEASAVGKEYITVSHGKKIQLLKLDDIMYCESFGHYTNIYMNDDEKIICPGSIGVYEKRLPTSTFIRIHKKYLVNISAIKYIHKSNRYYCELFNGKTLTLSRSKQEEIRQLLK